MSNPIAALAVGLAAGAGLGALVTATLLNRPAPMPAAMHATQDPAHDHTAHDHTGTHAHQMLDAGTPAPTLTLQLHPDGTQSRNLQLITTNFTFDAAGANGPHIPGHGHAHVYVNGVKLPRAYAPWVHLDALPKGTHDIRVTLNANDHSHLSTNGQPIEARTEITID